jgi:hypothetical protein
MAPAVGVTYRAFLDFAGGNGGDSATVAIAHHERRETGDVAVLDCLREVRPPFSPEAVCQEFAEVCRAYGVTQARADRFAGQFPVEQMRKYGISVEPAVAKSELYRELLPRLSSGRIELLDVPRLDAQLVGLERRTARGGRDSIDHAPAGHDALGPGAGCRISPDGSTTSTNHLHSETREGAGRWARDRRKPSRTRRHETHCRVSTLK